VIFVEVEDAANFKQHVTKNGITIHNRRVKAGWGNHSGPLSPELRRQVDANESRVVYIGLITDFNRVTREKLQEDFQRFGGE
jgi:hypothetical protein